MGVTYKLKQEVIDFIIEKKKEDASLSCRKLASLLQETLQIEVSKSSINAVIKEFHLSNPVGRRADVIPKNFIIPPEKKEQLFAQVAPFLKVSAKEPEPVVEKEEALQENIVHLAPDLLASKNFVEEPFLDLVEEEILSVDNMGVFLTWILMQDVMRKPVLGRVLARAAGMEDEVASSLEAAIFLKTFGLENIDETHKIEMQALLYALGMDLRQAQEAIGRFLGKKVGLSYLAVALEAELGAAFMQGSAVRCVSDTGRQVYFTADLGAFITGLDGGAPCPAFKAIEGAVDLLGIGKEPLVFELLGGFDEAARDLSLFLDGRSKDRMDKMELWSNAHEKIWELTIRDGVRYDVVMGAGRDQGLLEKIRFDETSREILFCDPLTGEKYALKEGVLVVDESQAFALRAILMTRTTTDEKRVVLTNILKKCMNENRIFEKYLEKRTLLSIKDHKYKENGISHVNMGNYHIKYRIFDKNDTIIIVLDKVFCYFKNYLDALVFEKEENKQNIRSICDLKGKKKISKRSVQVQFQTEEAFAQRTLLQEVIVRLNHCCIKDYMGRTVQFTL